ncbi:phytanoyl-CoA dioxygenase family protein [Breoghania sp. L-A4]|uniref:phytanoyl-CoA dioxygenase family protein n=1 Tax=Breoghania sp. L-A4 TaxID=2304600 RepID=UPI000E35CEF1|nr:phytanoyl-CoA dioxygenase family protein [Breoghania sp. L-A4]AXS41317.1 phytanoyl-CoA dioxygenase [Breoghania sp. L-A4]
MKAVDIVKAPIWLAELATGAKSFVGNPIIGSPRLNRLGLHEKRVMLAQRMADVRRRQMRHLVDAEDAEAFARDGYVVRRNALPDDAFARLRDEVEGNEFSAQEMVQGQTVTRFCPITRAMTRAFPELGALVNGRLFQGLLRYVASRNADPITFIHTVFADPHRGGRDPQTVFHSDTFHPTAKAWYFLTDVEDDGGPFTFVPGSHRMTPQRLAWEREKAITARAGGPSMHGLGSFRVTDEELSQMGYAEPVRVAVPANTLVVADTHGFHARAVSHKPTVRLGIYGSLRKNPFVPWAGLDPFDLPGLSGRQAEIHDAINNWAAKRGKTGQPPVGMVKPLDPPVRWKG